MYYWVELSADRYLFAKVWIEWTYRFYIHISSVAIGTAGSLRHCWFCYIYFVLQSYSPRSMFVKSNQSFSLPPWARLLPGVGLPQWRLKKQVRKIKKKGHKNKVSLSEPCKKKEIQSMFINSEHRSKTLGLFSNCSEMRYGNFLVFPKGDSHSATHRMSKRDCRLPMVVAVRKRRLFANRV